MNAGGVPNTCKSNEVNFDTEGRNERLAGNKRQGTMRESAKRTYNEVAQSATPELSTVNCQLSTVIPTLCVGINLVADG